MNDDFLFLFLKLKISGEHEVEKLCPHGLLRAERPHHRPGVSLEKKILLVTYLRK
jgi:hypothetical protein